MRLLSLFLRYGDDDYYGAINRLCLLYRGVEGLKYDVLLIDNSLPADILVYIGPNIVMVGGDNTRREFSGWNSVLKWFPDLLDGYDLVNIVTSAFENEYNGFYQYINNNTFEYAMKNENVVLAHVDAYPDSVRLFGRSFQTWGCSKFLLTVPERIKMLDTFVGGFSGEDFFSCNTDKPFKEKAPLSENYRTHLLNWVTGSGLPHGQWHSVFEMSEKNMQRFFSKAMSIVDEHSLSVRFRETGARIIDFTWLHSKNLDAVVKSIPDEVTQVQERNLFLFGDRIIDAHLDMADYPTERTIGWLFNSKKEMKKVFGRTPLIDALWIGNSDLRESFDLNCELHVAAIYLDHSLEINEQQRAWLSEIDNDIEQDVILPITKGIHAFYLARDDIQKSFNLMLTEGRRELILWWMRTGIIDPELAGFMPEDVYMEIDNTLEQDATLPITKGLHALWSARHDLHDKFDLATTEGRRDFICWWMAYGICDLQLPCFMSDSIYLETDDSIVQDASLPITKGLHAFYGARNDLQNLFDINTREGRRELILWWMHTGIIDPELPGFMPKDVYMEIDNTLEQDAPLPITKGLHALYAVRNDLQNLFDINTREGRRELILWWMRTGIIDPELAGFMPEDVYMEIDNTLEQDATLPITKGLHALWSARHDLHDKFDLATTEGRRDFICWWMAYGICDRQLPCFMSDSIYLETDDSIVQDASLPITKGLHAFYGARNDLQNLFDINTSEGRKDLLNWFRVYMHNDSSVKSLSGLSLVTSSNHLTNKSGMYMQGGVNIIGFAKGELGIGEDVRMASMALRSEDVDHCVPMIPLQLVTRQEDQSLKNYEVAYPLYNLNIIYLPHYETIHLAGATGDMILGHRNNIACWQWELPKFPKGMELALDLVDEIWSSTKFTADAMCSVTDKPVYVMPMAVSLPKLTYVYRRVDFSLSEDEFVFLNVMDGNSSICRKNPLAAIKAFQMAFPKGIRGVRMMLKTMNMDDSSPDWEELLRLCSKDDRITIISETMARQKVIGLQTVCDCFVSLHRAEGFGRNIAEAMLLGKPVIVSNFSGNTDFTNDKTAFMVDGETIPVQPNEYNFSEGQYWWDPDVVTASDMMKLCVDDAIERKLRADAGLAFVSKQYSPESIGKKYFERLNSFTKSLGNNLVKEFVI